MKIAIPKESRSGEKRVAASVDVVKKLVAFGFDVIVEKGAGIDAATPDDLFKAAGATIAKDAAATLKSLKKHIINLADRSSCSLASVKAR